MSIPPSMLIHLWHMYHGPLFLTQEAETELNLIFMASCEMKHMLSALIILHPTAFKSSSHPEHNPLTSPVTLL